MRPARIILLLVALIAGGLAAFLATRGQAPAPQAQAQATRVIEESKTQVLVASRPIGVGERLTAATLKWQDWPEGAMLPQYITIDAMPDAVEGMTGAVARFEIFEGEPIRAERLVRTNQGYLSAVLTKGMRGVSIAVTAESGAGGFIVPNDHVDVVLTRSTASGEVSETILTNVKVLAIGQRLGEVSTSGGGAEGEGNDESKTFTAATIATLELDPAQGERVINAASVGRISLALRSITDFKPDAVTLAAEQVMRQNSTAIRVIRFGQQTSVLPVGGTTPGAAGSVAPAATPAAVSYNDAPAALPGLPAPTISGPQGGGAEPADLAGPDSQLN